MPCQVPPLFIRLPPDYLALPRVNWLVRGSDFMVHSQAERTGEENSFYTRDEVNAFRKTASTLIAQFLEGLRLRQRLTDQLTLFTVTEVWASFVSLLMKTRLFNNVNGIFCVLGPFNFPFSLVVKLIQPFCEAL